LAYRERHARALYRQGDEQGDNAALKEAIRAYRDLLGAYPRERAHAPGVGHDPNRPGQTLWYLGIRESDMARLEAARRYLEDAWRVYQDAGMEHDEYFRQLLAAIDQLIAERE